MTLDALTPDLFHSWSSPKCFKPLLDSILKLAVIHFIQMYLLDGNHLKSQHHIEVIITAFSVRFSPLMLHFQVKIMSGMSGLEEMPNKGRGLHLCWGLTEVCRIPLTKSLSATGMSRTYVSGWFEIAYIYSKLCLGHMDEEFTRSRMSHHRSSRWKFLLRVPK